MQTQRDSAVLLTFFHLRISPQTLSMLNVILRKVAHFCEYAVLSLLLYRCFRGPAWLQWEPRLAGWCIVIALAYGLTDELHQVFVQGRRASLCDCGLDTAGALAAMLAIQVRSRFVGARRESVGGRNHC